MSSYEEQRALDADRLQRATGLTHGQYMVALSLLIISQLREAELLLERYQLPSSGRWCDRETCSSPEKQKRQPLVR